ncbi:MAG: glycosyltransferase [Bacteroidales bacterium]|nr:glycosyltransferase [Bacteroidales bacterium]
MVSVIIPVYNTEKYLSQCLESVLCQTFRNIEIICVDDGSTDNSKNILQHYQEKDKRITVIMQTNLGGGGARNRGIEASNGEYLLFLDSDDFIERDFIEKMHQKCLIDNADIAICGFKLYDNKTGKRSNPITMVDYHLPHIIPFSYKDNKKYIFNSFPPVVWNRLYKHEFILKSQLKFQEIHHHNDNYFSLISLVLADKITLIHDSLINYRVNQINNTQSTNYNHPFDFSLAISAIKNKLIFENKFYEVEQSFTNYALNACIYQEKKLRGYESHEIVCEHLKNDLFQEYGLNLHSINYYYDKYKYLKYLLICKIPPTVLERGFSNEHIKLLLMNPKITIEVLVNGISRSIVYIYKNKIKTYINTTIYHK